MEEILGFKTYQEIKSILIQHLNELKTPKAKRKLKKFNKMDILETKDIMLEHGYVFNDKPVRCFDDL